MASADNKVKVSIRVRPLIQREHEAQEPECWMCYGNVIQQMIPGTSNVNTNSTPYSFDHIFDQGASTKEIYRNVVKPIVENSFLGFNGAVLCYGQTSSGKTFTLYGSDEEPGIISLTAMDLFNRINEDAGRQYYIRVGLLEVYNEKVWDLLAEEKKQIELITSKEMNGTVVPKDLEELEVLNADEMLNAAKRLQTARRVGETKMNKDSSRSHTIVRIIVESIDKSDSENLDPSDSDREVTSACLNLVDLAGSEKASQTGAVGDRFKEATYINKSLSALAQVVLQLSQASSSSIPVSHNTSTGSQSTRQSSKYISFRDSKLTRLLQSSLEGNAFISLICNVTPASVDETHSTLRFARTAKSIKVDPTKNLRSVNECHQYKSKITELERMLNDKTSEVTKLQERLSKYQSFRPAPRILQSSSPTDVPDRRKTLCLSQLQWDRNKIGSKMNEFKHPSILKNIAALKSIQRSSSTTEVFADATHVFQPAESPPKRKRIASPPRKTFIDAETNTETPQDKKILAAEVSQNNMFYTPMARAEVDQTVDWPDKSMLMHWQSEKSFLAHEMDYEKEELQKQVEDLQKVNQQLQEEVESLKTQKQTSEERQNSEVQQLQISHRDFAEKQQHDMVRILKSLEDVESELRSALEREEHQKAENCLLASKVATLQEDDDDMMQKNNELENELSSLRKALEALTQQLESEKTLNASLLEEREASRLQTFSETDMELQEMKEQRDFALSEAAEWKFKLEAITEKYEAAVKESEALSDAKLAVDDELLLAQERLDDIIKEHQQNIRQLKTEIITLEKQLDETATSKQSLACQLISHQEKSNELTETVQILQEKLNAAIENEATTSKAKLAVDDELRLAQERLDDIIKEHQQNIGQLKTEIRTLDETLTEITASKQSLECQLISHQEKTNELTGTVQILEKKLNVAIENAAATSKAKLAVDDELLGVQQKLEEVMKDQQQKLMEFDEVSAKVRAVEKELGEVKIEKSSLQDLLTNQQEQLKHYDDYNAKLEDLQRRYTTAVAAAEDLSSAKLIVDDKLLLIQEQLNDAIKDKQQNQEEANVFRAKVKSLEEQLEERSAFDDLMRSHQEQSEKINELTSTIHNLQKKFERAVAEAESLSDAKLAADDELLLLQEKFDELTKEQLQQMVSNSKLEDLERRYNDAVAAAEEQKAAKMTVDEKLLVAQEQLNDVVRVKQQKIEELAEFQAKVTSLQEQLENMVEKRCSCDDLQSSNELTSNIENLRQKYEAAVKESEALSDAKLAVDDELLLAQERLDDITKEHQQNIGQLKTEIRTLDEKLTETTTSKQSLECQLISQQEKTNDLAGTVQILEEKLNAAIENAAASSEAKLAVDDKLRLAQERLDDIIKEHQQNIDQLKAEMITLEKQLDETATSKQSLECQLISHQEKTNDLAVTVQTLEEKLNAAIEHAEATSKAKLAVDDELRLAQEKLDDINKEHQQNIHQLKTKIITLEKQLDETATSKQFLECQLMKTSDLDLTVQILEEKLSAANENVEAISKTKLAVDDELRLAQERLDDIIKEHQQNIDQLKTEIRTLDETLTETTASKQSLECQLISHQEKSNELTGTVQILEEKLNAAIEHAEATSKAKLAVDDELLGVQRKLEHVMKDQQQKFVEVSMKVKTLEEKLDEVQMEKSSLENKLQVYQEQVKISSDSASKLEDMENKYLDAIASTEELSRAKLAFEDRLQKLQEELNSAIEEKQQKQLELEVFQSNEQHILQQLEKMTEDRKHLNDLLLSHKSQSAKVDELTSTVMSLEKKYEMATTEAETVSGAKRAVDDELLVVQGKLEIVTKELESKLQEVNRHQSRIHSLEDQVVRLDDLMRNQQQEQEYRAASHESVVSNLNHRLQGLQDELESAQLEKKVVVDEYTRLQTFQKDMHEKLTSLEESNRNLQTSQSLELSKHADELKRTQSQIDFWKNKSEEHFAALEAGTEYRATLEKKLSSLQRELEKARQSIETLKSSELSLREDLAALERIKEDLEATRKVKKRSIDCQTGSVDIFKQKNYYETEALRATKKLKELDTSTKKELASKTQQIKELTAKLEKVQPQITQLQETLVVYRTQAEENKPVPRPQAVSMEVQVDTLRDSLHRLVRGQRSELPKGYPDVYSAMKDYERTKAEVAILESWKRRCECNMKDVNKSNMPVSTYRPVGCIPPHTVSSAILWRSETTPKTTENPSPVARRTRSQVETSGVDSCPSPSVRFGVNLKPMKLTPSRDPASLLPSSAKRGRNEIQSPAPTRTYNTRSASAPSASTADTERKSTEDGMSEIERLTFAYIGS